MADRRMQYRPPILDRKIKIRNPALQPTIQTDDFGRRLSDVDWGDDVWANRRDRATSTANEEGVPVHESTTVWTIRWRAGVDANVQVIPFQTDGTTLSAMVYESAGMPLERGGPQGGIRELYLEIHTKLRQ